MDRAHPAERARANRLRQDRALALRVRTRALVRRVLATYRQVAPQDVAIAAGLRRSTTDVAVTVLGVGGPVEDPGLVSPRAWYVDGLEIESGFSAAVAADGEVAVTIRPWASPPGR